MGMRWTPERIETLKTLWADGKSATEIAMMMGGISRNAVMGKVHRLDIHARLEREANAPRKPLVRTPRQPRVAKPKTIAPKKPAVAPKPVDESIMGHMEPGVTPLLLKLFELDARDCRWPVSGEKADTLFCGHPMMEGSSYCCFHRNLSRGEGTRSERAVAAMIKRAA